MPHRSNLPAHLCLHHCFEDQVDRIPEAIAVSFETEQLSYRELDRRANQLARMLQESGTGPEALVGICMERSTEMVIGLLGILKAGAAYVPLDPTYPLERLQHMVHDAGMSVILTQHSLRSLVTPLSGQVICLDADWPSIGTRSQSAARIASTAR